jgi:DNA invertase Pin-like site-specific DNA recombinase
MDKKEVIEHFGGVSATARALGITKSAVSKWPEKIPWGRALQIEKLKESAASKSDGTNLANRREDRAA